MRLEGNTVLVTGGASGIGRGLAIAMAGAGNRVIIAGRRTDALRAVADGRPGIEFLPLDVSDTECVEEFVTRLDRDHPDLNVVINNAGVMAIEDLTTLDPARTAEIVATNLLGPILLTSLLIPRLRSRAHSAVINVTSALAFVPMATAPTYCATKAGLHSFTESLRFQLRDSVIQVIEVVPPRVRTDMVGPTDDRAIDLDAFIAEVISALANPHVTEIVVGAARGLRYAERDGAYDQQLVAVNDRVPPAELENMS